MLLNGMRPAEVRAAILHKGRLDQLEIEVRDAFLLKGNIYKGRIANVESSLNACFVEFGAEKQGFLPIDEIAPSAYHKKWTKKERPRITDVMQKGREILVQVVKDAVGNKGAALTTRISLAGRYIVLMPLDDTRGVSRKISSDKVRKQTKELAAALKVPEEYGFIVRTAGMERTKTDLNRDVAQLVRSWRTTEQMAEATTAPALLHEDRDLVVRMLRDYYDSSIDRILIDSDEDFGRAMDYFTKVMPRNKSVLQHYSGRVPLFARYNVETQIDDIFSRRADLPSGGYILIDPTEALISIDVNSGRSTKQKSQEETALHTNLEAAAEVARQLRLRDLGGLIVIDFIDMSTKKANRDVEKAMKEAMKPDKARSYVSKISENGLLEVNRQRLRQALQSQTHRSCPTCEGVGVIPAPDFISRKLLRTIEAKAAGSSHAKVIIKLHPELADHLQNLNRRGLIDIENRFGLIIEIEGRPGLHRGEEEMRWLGMSALTEAEKRIVLERRDSMLAANKQLSGGSDHELRLQDVIEDEFSYLDGTDDALLPEDESELDIAAAREDSDSDDQDNEEGTGDSPGRRSRRGRGRSRARGRGPSGASAAPREVEGEEGGRGGRRRGADDDDSDASRSKRRRMRRKRGRDGEPDKSQAASGEGRQQRGGEDQEDGERRRGRGRGRGRGRNRGRNSEDGEARASGGSGERQSEDGGEPRKPSRGRGGRGGGRGGNRSGGRGEDSSRNERGAKADSADHGSSDRSRGSSARAAKPENGSAASKKPSGASPPAAPTSGSGAPAKGGSSDGGAKPTGVIGGLKRYLGISSKGDSASGGSAKS